MRTKNKPDKCVHKRTERNGAANRNGQFYIEKCLDCGRQRRTVPEKIYKIHVGVSYYLGEGEMSCEQRILNMLLPKKQLCNIESLVLQALMSGSDVPDEPGYTIFSIEEQTWLPGCAWLPASPPTPLEIERRTVAAKERVRKNRVREVYWVQRYIAVHYRRLGFEGLEGPFESGPDFRVLYKGKWIVAEAETVCENYIKHGHHNDSRWSSCAVLIVLSEEELDNKDRKNLPKTIVHIDKAHFTNWYLAAAKEYALGREKKQKEEAEANFAALDWSKWLKKR